MDSEHFISVVKRVVSESAVENTVKNLEDPPGRLVPEAERIRSDWFNGLSDNHRDKVESIIRDAVDDAVFGLL